MDETIEILSEKVMNSIFDYSKNEKVTILEGLHKNLSLQAFYLKYGRNVGKSNIPIGVDENLIGY